MPDTTLTTLAVATGGAFLGKFVGPAAEAIGKAAWEQAQQLGAQATAYLAAVGREPQPVEPKLLLPLVQAASLETDPTLSEKWAALLANAADPAKLGNVKPGFVGILRELTAHDALVLDAVADAARSAAPNGQADVFTKVQAIKEHTVTISDNDFCIVIDNLVRLNLCTTVGRQEIKRSEPRAPFHPGLSAVGPGKDNIAITYLGLAFLAAVAPPSNS